jgi:alpha-amylase/alpha-mannosidase (GH57 family)
VERYICIHGHFYQPPRENPWLEAVEVQDSAYPYHDWNERITAECYGPNSAARILDGDGRILQIINNYARMSFNFGPTLLAWLAEQAPAVYRTILDADRESQERYSGHGSALAQAYNHMILPLANARDKRTQVLWGLRDFEFRYGRKPEGMWLPETAVDVETLDILAEQGIRFTILSPTQARRARALGARHWRDVSNARIDPSTAYRVRLPSGHAIHAFFYDAPISWGIAFEDLLVRGENLARRLAGAFSEEREGPQLVHIATDGETYGHHRVHGDMALAYALHYAETTGLARLTNYGEFLEHHPPTREVEVFPNSSWSCAHGIERWRSECGCNSGMRGEWRQHWRAPLREALDWLRDTLAPRFEAAGQDLLKDPWEARDDYIRVILDRAPESVEAFLAQHGRRPLAAPERVRALQLLELQRQAMLMYTSCGWFFDELSGIETVQVIQYAGRVVQLARQLGIEDVEEDFLSRLEKAPSNVPEHSNGRVIFDKFVRPAMVDLSKVAAHYAVSSLFEDYGESTPVYAYTADREDFHVMQQGHTRLALGRVHVASRITGESDTLSFGVLHLGDQNVSGGVREFRGEEAYEGLLQEMTGVFERGDIPELIRGVDRHFGAGIYTLRLLFRDEQRRIVGQILDSALGEVAAVYRNVYGKYSTLARFITDLGIPLPTRFQMAADFALNEDLLQALSAKEPDLERVSVLCDQVRLTSARLDAVTLEFAARRGLERAAAALSESPEDHEALLHFELVAQACARLPFEVNLWQPQNAFFGVMQTRGPGVRSAAADGDGDARTWLEHAAALGELLKIPVDRVLEEKV